MPLHGRGVIGRARRYLVPARGRPELEELSVAHRRALDVPVGIDDAWTVAFVLAELAGVGGQLAEPVADAGAGAGDTEAGELDSQAAYAGRYAATDPEADEYAGADSEPDTVRPGRAEWTLQAEADEVT